MQRRSRASSRLAKGRIRKAQSLKAVRYNRASDSSQETELARLTREVNEALEQQAATSKILKVIGGSLDDLGPVFATMLAEAVRICDADFGNIYRWDNHALHLAAAPSPNFAAARRFGARRPLQVVWWQLKRRFTLPI